MVPVPESLEELESLADNIRKSQSQSPNMEEQIKIEMPPWIKDSGKSMEQYFVDLTLKIDYTSKESDSKLVNDYKEVFIHLNQSIPVKKILLVGDPGIGKSTLSKKIAWDWTKGNLTSFSLVFLIVPQLAKKGVSIETTMLRQYSFLERSQMKEENLKTIFEKLGSNCLLIFDGFDQDSKFVQNVIKEDKFRDCNILVTSRPHNARKLKKFFHEIVVVEGFAPDKAVTFANRILHDSHKVPDILNFKFKDEEKLFSSPLLLSMLCFLSASNEIDVSCKTMYTGEIYTRMIRCLYKTYTLRKKLNYDQDKILKLLKLLGKLAL